MIGAIFTFGLGYFVWKYVPNMISRCPKNLRLVLEIAGIILMIMGCVSLLSTIIHLF